MFTTHSAKSSSPIVKAASSAAAGAVKALTCLSLASVVTVLLFRLDSMLVERPSQYDTQLAGAKVVDFVRVQTEDYTRVKERRLPRKPPPPDRPPPPPKMRVNSPTDVPASAINMDLPDIEMNFGAGGGPYLGQWYGRSAPGQPDSDVVPIVRISPQYPRQALINGVEGWVQIEFTITPDGRVRDPVVVDAQPRGVFNRAAMQAILRWKFKPRFIDGQAIERRASQIITFELDA